MSFGDDLVELPELPGAVAEVTDPERDHALVTVAHQGHDAALSRALGQRLGLPAPSVVRLGLLALARRHEGERIER